MKKYLSGVARFLAARMASFGGANFDRKLAAGLPRIGLECGDIDERTDLRVGARIRDHRAGIAVADEHNWTCLLIDGALGGLDVFREAGELLLDDRHVEAILGQKVVD